jgi:cytochrome b561
MRRATFAVVAGSLDTESLTRFDRRNIMNTHKSLGFLAAVLVTVIQVAIFATATASIVA